MKKQEIIKAVIEQHEIDLQSLVDFLEAVLPEDLEEEETHD